MTDTEFYDVDLARLDYIKRRHFGRRCAEIEKELRVALSAYLTALNDPQGKSEALMRFDAGFVSLREVYREADWHWEGPPQVVRISVSFRPSNAEEELDF